MAVTGLCCGGRNKGFLATAIFVQKKQVMGMDSFSDRWSVKDRVSGLEWK
jgi:hypothetical protein